MRFTSVLAIYLLFFAGSTFILLPFGVRTTEELGEERIPGQAESAPHRFDLPRHLLKAAILAAVLLTLYYVNWVYGWITAEDLDFYH